MRTESQTSNIDDLKKASERAGEGLFTRICSDSTRGSNFKLEEDLRFKLETRVKVSNLRMVRDWNKLPRVVVHTPPLAVFKAILDGSNLAYWSIPWQGEY